MKGGHTKLSFILRDADVAIVLGHGTRVAIATLSTEQCGEPSGATEYRKVYKQDPRQSAPCVILNYSHPPMILGSNLRTKCHQFESEGSRSSFEVVNCNILKRHRGLASQAVVPLLELVLGSPLTFITSPHPHFPFQTSMAGSSAGLGFFPGGSVRVAVVHPRSSLRREASTSLGC